MQKLLEKALRQVLSTTKARQVAIIDDTEGMSGSVRLMMTDGRGRFAEGGVSWGSCPECDSWGDATAKEIVAELVTTSTLFETPELVRRYAAEIVKENPEVDPEYRFGRDILDYLDRSKN